MSEVSRNRSPARFMERRPNILLGNLWNHLPEYAIEGIGLAMFMVSACFFSVWLFHPDYPATEVIPQPVLRRLLMGIAMGTTAASLIYSPFGQRSGAHFNPAVTLAFWRLGKVQSLDAIGYAISQTLGGLAGVALSGVTLGSQLADINVHFAATIPGPFPIYLVWLTEFAMSAAMFGTVLFVRSRKGWEPRTGFVAATLLALFILLGGPISGTSLNPSRSLATATLSGDWSGFAIYLTAPIAGMVMTAELFRGKERSSSGSCAKLIHSARTRCIFCGYPGPKDDERSYVESEVNSPAV